MRVVPGGVLPALFLGLGVSHLSLAFFAWGEAFTLKIILLGAMFLVLTVFEWRRNGDPITAAGMIGMGGGLIFFLRPIGLPGQGVTSPGALINQRPFAGPAIEAASIAATQIAVFLLFFGFVYFYTVFKPGNRLPYHPPPTDHPNRSDPDVTTLRQVRRSGVLLVAGLVVAISAAALLVQSSGGLQNHFFGVANRSSFLAGRVFLTLGYVPLVVVLTVNILIRRRCPDVETWTPLRVAAAAALVVIALATGGRGPLILGAMVPLLLLKQIGPRPLRTGALVGFGLFVVAGAMVMSIVLRDNVYTSGQAVRELQERPVATLVDRLTSGVEARPFDSLILLNELDGTGDLEFQNGTTYAKVPTWFVPGSIIPSKDGGANTWFTKTYLPTFYYPNEVETSISAIGEGYANFAWPGVALIGSLVGWAAARFGRLKRCGSIGSDALYVILTPVFFSFVRGDAYQNLSLAVAIVLAVWATVGLSRPPQLRGTRARRAAEAASLRQLVQR